MLLEVVVPTVDRSQGHELLKQLVALLFEVFLVGLVGGLGHALCSVGNSHSQHVETVIELQSALVAGDAGHLVHQLALGSAVNWWSRSIMYWAITRRCWFITVLGCRRNQTHQL